MKKYITKFNNTSVMTGINTERMIFWSLSSLLVISFITYLLLTGLTTLNVAERKSLEDGNKILSSKVSELELKYLSETKKIDLNLAYSLGFKDAVGAAFAVNGVSPKDLSFAKSN